jgi:hypothetical protein
MTDTTRDIVLRLEGTVNSIQGTVIKLDKAVNGNGVPGMKTDLLSLTGRVEDLEDRHCTEDKTVEKRKARSWDIHKGVVLLAVGQVLTLGGLGAALYLGLK